MTDDELYKYFHDVDLNDFQKKHGVLNFILFYFNFYLKRKKKFI